ncbi:hypothetical protein [Weizmannia acidilactici]|nr:hypothetical protein [Weizmannia acidilactici]
MKEMKAPAEHVSAKQLEKIAEKVEQKSKKLKQTQSRKKTRN